MGPDCLFLLFQDGSLISEPTGKQETMEAPFCSGSGGTDHLDDRTGAEERLEMKPPDHHQNHETKGRTKGSPLKA